MIIESPVILTAKVSDKHKSLNYNDEKYHLTTIKVKDLYRDQNNLISKNDDIILFQNDFADIDPLAKKNEDLLLFLVKIDVPDYENVYRAIGLYKGLFKEQESAFVNELFDNKKSLKINKKDLKSLIEANQYLPKQNKSKEELDREEQAEEQNPHKSTK